MASIKAFLLCMQMCMVFMETDFLVRMIWDQKKSRWDEDRMVRGMRGREFQRTEINGRHPSPHRFSDYCNDECIHQYDAS